MVFQTLSSLPVFRPMFRGTFPASPQLNTAYWDVFMTEAFFTALEGQEVFFFSRNTPPPQYLLMFLVLQEYLYGSRWEVLVFILKQCGVCQRCHCWLLLALARCAYEAAVPVIWDFLVPLLLIALGSLKTDWPEHRKCICMCMSLVWNCKTRTQPFVYVNTFFFCRCGSKQHRNCAEVAHTSDWCDRPRWSPSYGDWLRYSRRVDYFLWNFHVSTVEHWLITEDEFRSDLLSGVV